jgi:hypothetical protein
MKKCKTLSIKYVPSAADKKVFKAQFNLVQLIAPPSCPFSPLKHGKFA